MSTAAPHVAISSGISLARPHGKCAVCGRAIPAGEKFTAAVREGGAGLERLDVGSECWETFDKTALLARWRATMPDANAPARARMFVDDAVLSELFERLMELPPAEDGNAGQQARINFRFVLALVLMRKRLLHYESTRSENGREFWTVRMKGRLDTFDLLNPRMDEQQVTRVSEQLGQILSGAEAAPSGTA